MVTPLGITRTQRYVVAGMGSLLSLLLLVFKSIYPLPIAILLVILVAMVIMYGLWKKAHHLLISSGGNKEVLEDYYSRLDVVEEKDSDTEPVNGESEVVDKQSDDLFLEEIDFATSEDPEELEGAESEHVLEESELLEEESLDRSNIVDRELELETDAWQDFEAEESFADDEARSADKEPLKDIEDESHVLMDGEEVENDEDEEEIEGIDFSLRLESTLDIEENESTTERLQGESEEEASGDYSEVSDRAPLLEFDTKEEHVGEDDNVQDSPVDDFQETLNTETFEGDEEPLDEAIEHVHAEEESILDYEDSVNGFEEADTVAEVAEDPSEEIAGQIVTILREQARFLKDSGNKEGYIDVTEQLLSSHLTDDIYFAVAAEYRDFLIEENEWMKLNKLLDDMKQRCEYPLLLEEINYLQSLYKQK